MAVTSTDTTVIANAIMERKAPGFIDAVFRNDRLLAILRQFGLNEPDPGTIDGTSHKWDVAYSANASAGSYSEGDAMAVADSNLFVEAALAWVYFEGVIKVTGHAKDALKNGGHFAAIDSQFPLLQEDIKNQRTATYLGSGTNGILNAIAATGTYAGITRGSAAYWESYTDTTAEAQSILVHREVQRSIRAGDKGGYPNLHLTTRASKDGYANLIGFPAGTTPGMRADVGNGPANVDFGAGMPSLDDAPIIPMDDLGTGNFLSLDISAASPVRHMVIRPMQTVFHSRVGDAELYHVTTGGALVFENPKRCGKHTAYTT